MGQYEDITGKEEILAVQAIIELTEANIPPVDATGEWDTALRFAEQEERDGLAYQDTLDSILDGVSELA